MERETLAHALSATLLHVMLLREQGDTVEAERIMKELLNAFDQANQATREGGGVVDASCQRIFDN